MSRAFARRILLTAVGAAMCFVPASSLFAQTPQSQPDARNASDPIEGLWSSQVTITDCDTGAVKRNFKALNLFSRSGTVLDTDTQPPSTHGPGFGVWSRLSDSSYSSTFGFYRFNPDGSFAGIQLIQRTITLSSDQQSFDSTIDVSILDPDGNLLGNTCGTEIAARPWKN